MTIATTTCRHRPMVAVAGHLGAGKHALATSLVMRMGATLLSLGALVRDEARALGVSFRDVGILQEVGQAMVVGDCGGMVDRLLRLDEPGRPLVVSGLRHVEVLIELRRRLGPGLRLVHLDSREDVRAERLMARHDANRRIVGGWQNHVSEIQPDSGVAAARAAGRPREHVPAPVGRRAGRLTRVTDAKGTGGSESGAPPIRRASRARRTVAQAT